MLDEGGEPIDQIELGQPFSISATFEVREPIEDAVVEIGIDTPDGNRVASSFSSDDRPAAVRSTPARTRSRADLDLTLLPGEYSITVALNEVGRFNIDHVEQRSQLRRDQRRSSGLTGPSMAAGHARHVRPRSSWSVSADEGLAPLLDREQ